MIKELLLSLKFFLEISSSERVMRIFGVLVGFLWALSALGDVTQFAEDPAWPYCEETVEFYEINHSTPLGFSGATLLDLTSNLNAVKINYGYKEPKRRVY